MYSSQVRPYNFYSWLIYIDIEKGIIDVKFTPQNPYAYVEFEPRLYYQLKKWNVIVVVQRWSHESMLFKLSEDSYEPLLIIKISKKLKISWKKKSQKFWYALPISNDLDVIANGKHGRWARLFLRTLKRTIRRMKHCNIQGFTSST